MNTGETFVTKTKDAESVLISEFVTRIAWIEYNDLSGIHIVRFIRLEWNVVSFLTARVGIVRPREV